jgi:hypothetical protein
VECKALQLTQLVRGNGMVRLNLEKADGMSKFEVLPEDIQECLGIGEDGYRALLAGDLEVTTSMLAELSDLYNVLITDLIDYDSIKFGVIDCTARRLRGRVPKVIIEMDFHLRTIRRSIVSGLRLVHSGDFEYDKGQELSLDLKFTVNFKDLDVAAYIKGLNEKEKEILRGVIKEYVGYALDGVFTLSGYRSVKVGVVGL